MKTRSRSRSYAIHAVWAAVNDFAGVIHPLGFSLGFMKYLSFES
jgi:hypothetical protein